MAASEQRLQGGSGRGQKQAGFPEGFPHTWHLHAGSLNTQLNDMLSVMASDRYAFVKSVRLNGNGVLMSEEDCRLLVAALGAKAWESVSLVEVSSELYRVTDFVSCCPQAPSFKFKREADSSSTASESW
jgi:hypothetical protein